MWKEERVVFIYYCLKIFRVVLFINKRKGGLVIFFFCVYVFYIGYEKIKEGKVGYLIIVFLWFVLDAFFLEGSNFCNI